MLRLGQLDKAYSKVSRGLSLVPKIPKQDGEAGNRAKPLTDVSHDSEFDSGAPIIELANNEEEALFVVHHIRKRGLKAFSRTSGSVDELSDLSPPA